MCKNTEKIWWRPPRPDPQAQPAGSAAGLGSSTAAQAAPGRSRRGQPPQEKRAADTPGGPPTPRGSWTLDSRGPGGPSTPRQAAPLLQVAPLLQAAIGPSTPGGNWTPYSRRQVDPLLQVVDLSLRCGGAPPQRLDLLQRLALGLGDDGIDGPQRDESDGRKPKVRGCKGEGAGCMWGWWGWGWGWVGGVRTGGGCGVGCGVGGRPAGG
jgi:hypothetical protein